MKTPQEFRTYLISCGYDENHVSMLINKVQVLWDYNEYMKQKYNVNDKQLKSISDAYMTKNLQKLMQCITEIGKLNNIDKLDKARLAIAETTCLHAKDEGFSNVSELKLAIIEYLNQFNLTQLN